MTHKPTYPVYPRGGLYPDLRTPGGFAAGWTILVSLPVTYQAGWTSWSTFAFLLRYLFVALGFGVWYLAVLLGAARAYGG